MIDPSFHGRWGLPRFQGHLAMFLLISCGVLSADLGRAGESDFAKDIRPLLQKYCCECHAGDVTEADVDFGAIRTRDDVHHQPKVWLRTRRMLEGGQMPPKGSPQPSAEERQLLQGWVQGFLKREAAASAGDPGPVVLRRLNNEEYNYTIRDLTGVDSLDPTREFPVDGAAGEGFINTGSAQGMSPAMVTKYLEAAKDIASHLVLLPDGVRISRHTTQRDQTDEVLAHIQAFYRRFTEDGAGMPINLQGIKFNTNQGGLLPLEKYLQATLVERQALRLGQKTIADVARERSVNAKYLQTLWDTLAGESPGQPSPLIRTLRSQWDVAKPNDTAALVREIEAAQKALWNFNSIGHIGREGGPKSWMEAVSPVRTEQHIRWPLPSDSPESDMTLYLTASDLGDGPDHDLVVYQEPRIEFKADKSGAAPPPILLRDIPAVVQGIEQTLTDELLRTADYLAAALEQNRTSQSVEQIAEAHHLNARLLANWAKLVGLGEHANTKIAGHFSKKLTKVNGYGAINGWGGDQGASLLTNRTDQPVSFLTLTVPARGVTVHPWPEVEVRVAWQCPVQGRVRITGLVADADNKCGNGAAWRVEHLSESGRAALVAGVIENGQQKRFTRDTIAVQKGDVLSLIVNARDKNHVCDTTHIDLTLTELDGAKREWDLASDVVDRVLDGNPLADSFGNKDIWHFCTQKNDTSEPFGIPPGSALAQWRAGVSESKPAAEREKLAAAVQAVLTAKDAKAVKQSDQTLRRQLLDWNGPLNWAAISEPARGQVRSEYGLDPDRFGRSPDGSDVPASDLCLQAPRILEIRLPGALVAGGEFVTTARLHAKSGREGTVQIRVQNEKPQTPTISLADPLLTGTDPHTRQRVESSVNAFRDLFPPTLCYARIVPVDEVVTMTLYHREDDHLKRLMLNEEQTAEIDRLWDELFYISQEPLKRVVVFEQISEFATQDRPDLVKAFAPLQKPIQQRAEAFRRRQLQTEPAHLSAVLELADRAWRRPLSQDEQRDLRDFYHKLRDQDIAHEPAIRLLLVRVLTSPAFLYKLETPASGANAAPVSSREFAARLSYFLWSSLPDEELRTAVAEDRLKDDKAVLAQTRRMLNDPRTRRLAVQFACQWLHVRDFDQNDDKNEQLYPQFAELRQDMYEETVRFFEDMFRNNGSILDILDADHAFLNEPLARHYGLRGPKTGDWQRVEGIKAQGRGGVLGMATVLASQSGASRTSPILRGNWIYETLLGERLPRPPANVPQLPEEVPTGLTARQLIEHHSSQPACAKCHAKIDPLGFALEQYDAIGRIRPQTVDTKTRLPDGKTIEGIDGLRDYLMQHRKGDVVRQFCRKLLGFALGRELQLSDEFLLEEMQSQLEENNYRFQTAVEAIVTSPQFRQIRGAKWAPD